MLPGKKYLPEDFLRIVWRRRWLLLLPCAVSAAVTAVVARALPDRYRSDTLILVVPQRVPEAYVKSTVTARIEDRLQSISQQILSRTRLERIIQDFDLYAKERKTGIMEDIVEQMRREIDVQIVKGDAFRVAYMGTEPRTVMRVTERLASLFIDENLRDREVLAEGANQFLQSQLEDARQRLVEHEKKLEAFRTKYAGELPSQLESNIQVMQNAQMQITALAESLNRDRDRRLMLERTLSELTNSPQPEASSAPAATGNGDGSTDAPVGAAQQLEAAQASLRALEMRLKPEHPDVVRLKRVIGDLQKKADAEALQVPLGGDDAARPANPAQAARQNRVREFRLQMDLLDRQIATKQTEERRLRGILAEYERRSNEAPKRETELIELSRDYQTLQSIYTDLLSKNEASKVAANLERRQIGEQFKVLDPARMPERPFSPDRPWINMMGALGGLAFGIGLVVLLEYRDSGIRTDEEAATVLGLPVLATIPLMRTPVETRTLRRRRLAYGLCGAMVIVVSAGVVFWAMTF